MSRQNDINALTAKFEAANISSENASWLPIHTKIIEYRKEKKMTISYFLKACGLNSDRSYFKQLACTTGYKVIPSNVDGSVGKEFTDAVKIFFESEALLLSGSTSQKQDDSLSVLIEDWMVDNYDMLEEMEIQDIDCLGSKIRIHVLDGCTKTNEEILKLLGDGINRQEIINAATPSTRINSTLLAAAKSPLALRFKDPTDVGTGTTVYFKGHIVTLTAKHVCGKEYSDVVLSLEDEDPLTGKYKMDSETAEFGFIANEFKCPQADFAFVCPYPNMMFNVSYTNNLKRPIIINKWWDESLQNRLHKILGKVLIKDGVSSGLTTGGVLKDSFQDKSFYILGNELCPFAVPGDSGSLVCIHDTMEVVGMVLSIEVVECQETRRLVCQVLPVWKFYDWLAENISRINKYF